ncbi:related to mfs1 - putative multidrug transporter [Melanopsichium pennsylvanicum]|uniref:MFS-type efflux pump MMF1 n=2 Tax=Melanopsichium pennsylvanicum TaxID=63383 RepID=A0AAJ4XLD6_9BASI|nr:related to mfs1-putative multidrug transporter [Melanopsichium pennsylvanicum 4]SNX84310.1 related to mfs1 - putative multidrug transporter [Melanopsichium pennsylvanicum]
MHNQQWNPQSNGELKHAQLEQPFNLTSFQNDQEYRHKQPQGLGLSGDDFSNTDEGPSAADNGGESVAIGQTAYETLSAPQPVDPLSNSPTTPYFPWGSQQETTLRPMSSRSQLVPSRRESYSSTLHQQFHGGHTQVHHRGYWESSLSLQPSTLMFDPVYRVEMESASQFSTDKEEQDDAGEVGKHRLFQYGLHTADGKKTFKFWTLIAAFMITVTLTALDMTMISTALPSIVEDLPTSTIAGGWVTSSYLLSVTAFQPLFGGLSCVIGRRWSVVLAVILFVGGSVMCGFAHSILFLVIGRGVQGLGGGGIQAIGEITVSDITTLRERGFFVGIFGLVFAIASFIAPVLGGYFSDHDWRWIFWINIPIGVLSLLMLIPTMNLPVPSMPFKAKLAKMDLVGNSVLLGSVVSILIAVTEGGVTHPWSSMQIWIPLVAGMVGFILFLLIEFVPNPLSTQPVLPLKLFSNRTACSAFLMTFVHGIATYGAIYALPIYFQSIRHEKPLKSAVSTFPSTAPTAPFAIVAGVAMAITGKYRNLTFAGWAFTAGGFAWMTRFQTSTAEWELIVAQIIAGVGIGILFAITLPPIQASLPIEELESATATYAFCRSFGAIWGIAITTSVLTVSVSDQLWKVPEVAQLGLTGPTVLGYVENIKNLPEPIREQVKQMYADGLQKGMFALMPVVVVGFACCFWIKDLPLPDFMRDDKAETNEVAYTDQPEAPIQREQVYGERAHHQNQHANYITNEKSHFGNDNSQDTTLVESAEHHPPATSLTFKESYNAVRHHSAPHTPEGYASQSFKHSSSLTPTFCARDEKLVTAPPRAF